MPNVAIRVSFARLDLVIDINDAETRENGVEETSERDQDGLNTRERPSFPNYDELCKGVVWLCVPQALGCQDFAFCPNNPSIFLPPSTSESHVLRRRARNDPVDRRIPRR